MDYVVILGPWFMLLYSIGIISGARNGCKHMIGRRKLRKSLRWWENKVENDESFENIEEYRAETYVINQALEYKNKTFLWSLAIIMQSVMLFILPSVYYKYEDIGLEENIFIIYLGIFSLILIKLIQKKIERENKRMTDPYIRLSELSGKQIEGIKSFLSDEQMKKIKATEEDKLMVCILVYQSNIANKGKYIINRGGNLWETKEHLWFGRWAFGSSSAMNWGKSDWKIELNLNDKKVK